MTKLTIAKVLNLLCTSACSLYSMLFSFSHSWTCAYICCICSMKTRVSLLLYMSIDKSTKFVAPLRFFPYTILNGETLVNLFSVVILELSMCQHSFLSSWFVSEDLYYFSWPLLSVHFKMEICWIVLQCLHHIFRQHLPQMTKNYDFSTWILMWSSLAIHAISLPPWRIDPCKMLNH